MSEAIKHTVLRHTYTVSTSRFIELEVHTLSLKDMRHSIPGISPAAPAVKLEVILPERIHCAVTQGDFDIETHIEGLIVIINSVFGADAVYVLLVDPESGATTTWVEPELPEVRAHNLQKIRLSSYPS